MVSKAGFIPLWQMKKLKLRALSNLFSVVSDGGRSLHTYPLDAEFSDLSHE